MHSAQCSIPGTWGLQARQEVSQFGREVSVKLDDLASLGMPEADVLSVEKMPLQRQALLAIAIDPIPHHWMADEGHVDADLMRATGFRFGPHQAVLAKEL
jgi:hypothetical protein